MSGIVKMFRECRRKHSHPSRGKAEAHLRSLERRELSKDTERLRAYACSICRGWHVGHKKEVS